MHASVYILRCSLLCNCAECLTNVFAQTATDRKNNNLQQSTQFCAEIAQRRMGRCHVVFPINCEIIFNQIPRRRNRVKQDGDFGLGTIRAFTSPVFMTVSVKFSGLPANRRLAQRSHWLTYLWEDTEKKQYICWDDLYYFTFKIKIEPSKVEQYQLKFSSSNQNEIVATKMEYYQSKYDIANQKLSY